MIELSSVMELWSPWVLKQVLLTVSQVVVTLVFSSSLAWFLSYFLVTRSWLFMESFLGVFWVVPSFIIIALTMGVMRTLGLGAGLYDWPAVYFAWILGTVPILISFILKGAKDLDRNQLAAAQTLGAKPFTWFRTWVVPQVSPFFLRGLLQCAYLLLTSFSVVVILGGGSPRDTLETRIFQEWNFNPARVLPYAFWQSLLLLLVQGLGFRFERKYPNQQKFSVTTTRWVSPGSRRTWVGYTVVLFVAMLGAVIYFNVFWFWFQSMVFSLIVSVLTLFISVFMQTRTHKSKLKPLLQVGAWVSPIVLSWIIWQFSFLVGWTEGASIKIIIVQTILFLPWVSRTLAPMIDRARMGELHAALSLGATPFQAWWGVEWPRLNRSIFLLAGMVAAMSIADVSTVMMFGGSQVQTLSFWIQNQFSHFQIDSAMTGTVILVLSMAMIYFVSMQMGYDSNRSHSKPRKMK